LTEKVFGDLTVLRYEGKSKWICVCSCKPDKEISIYGESLRNGKKTNCGCKRRYTKREAVVLPKEYDGQYKTCDECGKSKEYKDFYYDIRLNKDKQEKYYFHLSCVECEKKTSRQWAIDNPEWYYIINKRKDEKLKKILYKRELSKQRRLDGRHQAWIDKNPDKAKQYSQDRYYNKIHDITKSEWKACKEYFNNSCAYCGLQIEEHYRTYAGKPQKIDLHKEHKNHDGSNALDNCIPACQSCNDKKWKFEFGDWYNENNPNFTQERLNKINQWINEDYKKYLED